MPVLLLWTVLFLQVWLDPTKLIMKQVRRKYTFCFVLCLEIRGSWGLWTCVLVLTVHRADEHTLSAVSEVLSSWSWSASGGVF